MPDEVPDTFVNKPEGGVDPRGTAQEIAKFVRDKMTSAPEGGDPNVEGTPTPQPVETPTGAEEPSVPGQDLTPAPEAPVAPAAPAEPAQAEEITDEVYQELLNYGIDLGVPPSEVSADLRPAYEQMAASVVDVVTRARMRELEAQELEMQVKDFMGRIESNPKDVLMLIALNKAEAFQEALDIWERMQEDPKERAMVERELEVRAREEALKRRADAQQAQVNQQKASRIKALTKRAAAKHSVDYTVAAHWVANEVRTQGEPSAQRIDEIVQQLRPAPTMVSPTKQGAVATVPTDPTPPTPAPTGTPARVAETSPGLEKADRFEFRNVMKEAFRRHTGEVSEE
jgi:hypothetical protein